MTIVSHGRPGKTQVIPYTGTPATSAIWTPDNAQFIPGPVTE